MWGSQPFYFGDSISVGVRDLQRSVEWYKEKLKLQLTRVPSEDYDALRSFDKKTKWALHWRLSLWRDQNERRKTSDLVCAKNRKSPSAVFEALR